MNKIIYDAVQKLTLDDVIKYQQQYVKGSKWNYAILGRIADLDMDKLKEYGQVKELTLEDIFGY